MQGSERESERIHNFYLIFSRQLPIKVGGFNIQAMTYFLDKLLSIVLLCKIVPVPDDLLVSVPVNGPDPVPVPIPYLDQGQ